MKRKKFITESILYISFGMLSGCSTENVAINDFMSHSQSSNLEFTDIEYKVLSNISKPRKIEPDEAKGNIASYNNGTRSEKEQLQDKGIFTKIMLGNIDDSISAILPDTLAYIYYSPYDDSYTITAADRRIDEPILAVVKDGNLIDEENSIEKSTILNTLSEYIYWSIKDYEDNKDIAMKEILEKINSSTASTRALDDQGYTEDELLIVDYEFGEWNITDHIDELLNVEWSQGEPYNDKVKNKESCGTVPTGCVATAVAQITSFWHYPTNIAGTSLNWAQLTSNKKIYTYETNKVDQVSTLMKVIGEGSDMDYGCDGSGTDTDDGRDWLNDHGYIGGTENDYNYGDVVSSLKSGCPVLASEYRELKDYIFFSVAAHGHAWVIDGFAERNRKRRRQVFAKDKKTGAQILITDKIYTEYSKLLHNNWGWGGNYNGWFPEGCFDSRNSSKRTDDITRYDSSRNYRYDRKIYIGLKPANL